MSSAYDPDICLYRKSPTGIEIHLTVTFPIFVWECPICNHRNSELEEIETAECRACNSAFEVVDCYGDLETEEEIEDENGDWEAAF